MKKLLSLPLVLLLLAATATAALAAGHPWGGHAAPYDFLFGNHIDTHQESKLVGKNGLQGFLYIRFTGETTEDGYPVAEHGNCAESGDCSAGWTLHGIRMTATYCGHPEDQHPQWAIPSEALPSQRGYSHFHWLGMPEHADGLQPGNQYDGYLLKLTARDTFFFRHHGGFLVTPGIDNDTHANVVDTCE